MGRLPEQREAFFKVFRLRLENRTMWRPNALLVELLESVFQHRPVNLLEHVHPNLDLVVGSDAEDLRVERGVV